MVLWGEMCDFLVKIM